jgi:hypothetical protein
VKRDPVPNCLLTSGEAIKFADASVDPGSALRLQQPLLLVTAPQPALAALPLAMITLMVENHLARRAPRTSAIAPLPVRPRQLLGVITDTLEKPVLLWPRAVLT